MSEKLEHVRRLLLEGYELDDIESDRRSIVALFRRGSRIERVRFLPHEAEALLDARPFEALG